MSGTPRDPWTLLDRLTPARVAIGRAGVSLPTREVLSFGLAHARARDAVHASLDRAELVGRLRALGLDTIEVESEARERATYLRRPDLGRRLAPASLARLRSVAPTGGSDLVLMLGDGLSATAVNAHAAELVGVVLPYIRSLQLRLGPVVVAEGARVALGDAVGAALGARLIAVVIGERPGLSASDSLSVYLTYDPRPGCNDSGRNCISSIRPGGLEPAAAAHAFAWLVEAALTRRATGIGLKDESDAVGNVSGVVRELGAADGEA